MRFPSGSSKEITARWERSPTRSGALRATLCLRVLRGSKRSSQFSPGIISIGVRALHHPPLTQMTFGRLLWALAFATTMPLGSDTLKAGAGLARIRADEARCSATALGVNGDASGQPAARRATAADSAGQILHDARSGRAGRYRGQADPPASSDVADLRRRGSAVSPERALASGLIVSCWLLLVAPSRRRVRKVYGF